jgi:hypothetical protein
MKKYLFVDLDEVLIHTRVLYTGVPSATPYPEGWGEYLDERIKYVAQFRPGARDLLKQLREIVPTERVFMLTSSVDDYANNWNNTFDLGFKKHQIYHRSDIERSSLEPLDVKSFPEAQAYLIDNLPKGMNRGKIQFLKAIDPNPTYLQVSEFIRSPDDDLTQSEIDSVISHITASERHDRSLY